MKSLATHRATRPSTAMQRLVDLCCDTRKHCALVLVANLGLVGCCLGEPLTAAFFLHVVLLPVNGLRLLRAMCAGPHAQVCAAAAASGEVAAWQRRVVAMRGQRSIPAATMQTVRLESRVPG